MVLVMEDEASMYFAKAVEYMYCPHRHVGDHGPAQHTLQGRQMTPQDGDG